MRTKKAFLIFLTDAIPLIIISIIGIFKIKIFIQILGTETLGLYQLFTQIMIYVALIDGGLTTAVLHSLYKPNSKNDQHKMVSILAGAKKTFSMIGIAVFAIAAVISFFMPHLIKVTSFNTNFIMLSFMLFSLSNVISYFFVPHQLLLEIKEKKQLVNLSISIGQIVQGILEIIMLLSGFSFVTILIMHSIIKLSSNLVIVAFCRKYYPDYNYKTKADYSFVKEVKHLIFHKINGLIGSNIDIIIISKFLGLGSVAIYASYSYIINMLKQIIGKFSTSMLALLGNYMVTDKKRSYDIFKELTELMFYIAIIFCVPLLLAFNYFIQIWYEGVITTSFIVAISFVAMLYIFIVKQPIVTYVSANGLFKETKICAMVDTITNLSLSLILVNYFGISGVLIATVISVVISEYFLKTHVVYKHIFQKHSFEYHKTTIKFIAVTLIDTLIGLYIFKNIIIADIFSWLLIFTLYSIINSIVVLGTFYIMKSVSFLKRFKLIVKRG